LEGMFSPTGLFPRANQIFVAYCSSDMWIGNALPVNNTLGWYFQGARIIRSVVDVLAGRLASAKRVVFTGCSTGGEGVVLNVDMMRQLVRLVAPTAQFWAIADGGWLLNEKPMSSSIRSLSKQFEIGLTLWGGLTQLGSQCLMANAPNISQCLFSPVALKYAQTPVLIQAEQYDSFLLEYNVGHQPPYNATEQTFVQWIRSDIYASLGALASSHAVFSPACFTTCLSLDSSFWNVQVAGSSFSTMASNFVAGVRQRVLDQCAGWNCSPGCPTNFTQHAKLG